MISTRPGSGVASGVPTVRQRNKAIQRRLLLFLHSRKCMGPDNRNEPFEGGRDSQRCSVPYCRSMKILINHMKRCRNRLNCTFRSCSITTQIVVHWRECIRSECPICGPVRLILVQDADPWCLRSHTQSGQTNSGITQARYTPLPDTQHQTFYSPHLWVANFQLALVMGASHGIPRLSHNSRPQNVNGHVNSPVPGWQQIPMDVDTPMLSPPESDGSFKAPEYTNYEASSCQAELAVSNEWRKSISSSERQVFIQRMLTAIFPSRNTCGIKDHRMYYLSCYVETFENAVYHRTTSLAEYHHSLARKLVAIWKELERAKHKKRLEQIQQHETIQSEGHVIPATPVEGSGPGPSVKIKEEPLPEPLINLQPGLLGPSEHGIKQENEERKSGEDIDVTNL